MIPSIPVGANVILIDGECIFCNGIVQFTGARPVPRRPDKPGRATLAGMNRGRLDAVGLAALVISVVAAIPLLPDLPWRHLAEPSYQAAVALIITAAVILGQRARGRRGSAFERRWLAVFLAGMPLVYGADWWVAGPTHALGLQRRSWCDPLRVGIVIHGAG